MKNSMDFFGKALLAYSEGDTASFFFVSASGKKHLHPLSDYFRAYHRFIKLEKKIISMSKGNILDVGCGTGNYVPYLMKQGTVLGIDISANVIQVAKRNKLNNCIVADIFTFKPKKKFDTIVLVENNLGMAETVQRTEILLKKLASMLNKEGCILTNARNVPNGTYYIGELYPLYKNRRGQKFKWISFNAKFLRKLCAKNNLKLEIVDRDKRHYLAKITKSPLKPDRR
ncbi:MAG: class I SAM-dependent methyltransferase [Candidatus Woesearchaeota archaeon]